jgi:hypothetical protein
MDKDKSILEKITDTIKDIANIAADAADHAMKIEQAPVKAAERSAAYIPLAADGLVSDPMMVPPIAAAHAPRRKRAASRRAAKASRKTRAKAVRKAARKVAKKSTARRSRSAARTAAATKINEKTAKKSAKKARKGIRKAT